MSEDFFVEDGLRKGIHQSHRRSTCIFIHVSCEAEFIESVEFYMEDGLEKAVHQ